MALKQSFCLPTLGDRINLSEFLPRLAQMGFAAVEIWQRDDSLEELVALGESTWAPYRQHGWP